MVEGWRNLALPRRPIKVVPPAPQMVIDALIVVRDKHPEIDRVIFRRDGTWEYSDSSTGAWEGGWLVDSPNALHAAASAAATVSLMRLLNPSSSSTAIAAALM